MKKIRNIITVFCLMCFFAYIVNISNFPTNVILKENLKFNYKLCPFLNVNGITQTSNSSQKSEYVLELCFGNTKIKETNIKIIETTKLIPVGEVIGLKLYTEGVMIVGITEIEDYNGILRKSVDENEVEEGDRILKANGIQINSIQDLKDVIKNNVNKVELEIRTKNNEEKKAIVTPIRTKDNEYKVGLWVKDAATGVGTLTYYNPETNEFAALGHGIIDSDTELILDIDSGEITNASVISINKAVPGNPGELRGSISNEETIGKIYKNTKFGILGTLQNIELVQNKKEFEIALRNEINEGNAKILCSIDGENVEEYDIEITKIDIGNNENNKSFEIKITDKNLKDKTGGIIRGLSRKPYYSKWKINRCSN